MTTPSKTVSAIRFILKDFNSWPSSVVEPKVYSTPVLDQAKLLAIDKSLRKKYLAINPAYVLPSYAPESLGVTVAQQDFHYLFNNVIKSAVSDVNTHYNQLIGATGLALPQFELAVEKLEYFTQLYSAFGALQNPQLWTINDGQGFVSLVVAGGFGDPAIPDGFRVIYISTLQHSV